MQVREVGFGAVQREKRQQLTLAARRREIDIVVVWRLDRWGRSLMARYTSFLLIQRLIKPGTREIPVALHSVN
jgi:DNA invertase Pin-like site-specific DNA recombinase